MTFAAEAREAKPAMAATALCALEGPDWFSQKKDAPARVSTGAWGCRLIDNRQ